jgi:putative ABC transport system permease protein
VSPPTSRWARSARAALANRISLADLLYLYRARLRTRTLVVQELFAVLGIASGVALLFASQVASTSLTRSVRALTTQIVGNTEQLQLDSRGSGGVSQQLLHTVEMVPGVRSALPVLEQQATVVGSRGRRAVDLIGTDPKLAAAHDPQLRQFSQRQLEHQQAIALPAPLAEAVGANGLEPVKIEIGAKVTPTVVGATLHRHEIGGLIASPVAFAPVAYAQTLSGVGPRLTRIFVSAQPARLPGVRAALDRLAPGAGVVVEPADFDATLFQVAAAPESQSESIFSAISALVGFMFAITAILVTIPARRRLIAFVTPHGITWEATLQILLFDAAVLTVVACALGLGLGELLSTAVFHATPGYLGEAFPVGDDRVVTLTSVVLAVGGGLVAATLGVLWPIRDALTRSPANLERPTHEPSHRWAVARLTACGCLGAATAAILLLRPQSAVLGCVTLLLTLVCALPSLYDGVVWACNRAQGALHGAAMLLAVSELRSDRTRVRALAIVATAAIAIFASVAIDGAQANVHRGLDSSARALDTSAEVWVLPSPNTNTFATIPFTGVDVGSIARLPGVAAVGVFRGSFFDWGTRRLWVLAPPNTSTRPVPQNQLIGGSATVATREIRSGGWAVISQVLASAHHLHVGQAFVLPSPRPTVLRVAALSTNLGWPPGTVILNSTDYARAWASPAPSAYEIQTRPGASPSRVKGLIERLLGHNTGLGVETAAERQALHYGVATQGLARLTAILLLVLIAGAAAVGVALGSMIWQRRDAFADLGVQGYGPGVLWRWICTECAVIVGAGCLIGAAFGIVGQLLISHALAVVTGFPTSLEVGIPVAPTILALGLLSVVAAISLAAYLVARVAPSTISRTN